MLLYWLVRHPPRRQKATWETTGFSFWAVIAVALFLCWPAFLFGTIGILVWIMLLCAGLSCYWQVKDGAARKADALAGKPNPGSDAATELGCTCPIAMNNHGERPAVPPSGWYVDGRCPVHGTKGRPR